MTQRANRPDAPAPGEPPRAALGGIFVGGRGTRMGGVAKGLLPAPEKTDVLAGARTGGTILDRWVALLRGAGLQPVLVGIHEAYASVPLEQLPDAEAGSGPLGGLVALCERAAGGVVVAVACDMPFVTGALLERLLAAPQAPVVAPRRENGWEPLFARYDASRVLPVARAHLAARRTSLQALLDAAGALELALDPDELRLLDDRDE